MPRSPTIGQEYVITPSGKLEFVRDITLAETQRAQRKKKRALAGMPVGEHHHAARLNESIVRRARSYKEDHDLCLGCILKLLDLQPQQRQALYDAINYVTWKHVR